MGDREALGLLDDSDLAQWLLASASVASAATEEFCRRFAPRIRLYGLRHLRDEQAADDLVQDVLLAVLEALREKRLEDPARLAHFVLGTCRFMVWNVRRADNRRQQLLQRYGHDLLVASESPALPVDAEGLKSCLAALSQRERQILFLTFFEEKGSQAIAQQLGLTPSNVRVIRHRALAQLRGCLEDRSAEERP